MVARSSLDESVATDAENRIQRRIFRQTRLDIAPKYSLLQESHESTHIYESESAEKLKRRRQANLDRLPVDRYCTWIPLTSLERSYSSSRLSSSYRRYSRYTRDILERT